MPPYTRYQCYIVTRVNIWSRMVNIPLFVSRIRQKWAHRRTVLLGADILYTKWKIILCSISICELVCAIILPSSHKMDFYDATFSYLWEGQNDSIPTWSMGIKYISLWFILGGESTMLLLWWKHTHLLIHIVPPPPQLTYYTCHIPPWRVSTSPDTRLYCLAGTGLVAGLPGHAFSRLEYSAQSTCIKEIFLYIHCLSHRMNVNE